MNSTQKEIIKNIKEDIKHRHLSKQDKISYYNEIYHIYGSAIYKQVTPKNVKKRDLKNLLKQGNFEDIYTKYGKSIYHDNLDYMKSKDIEDETGSKFRGALFRFNSFIKKNILIPILGLTFALPSTTIAISQSDKYEEEQKHLKEIEEYIDDIETYAQSVNDLKLSDIEVLMKVTKDMWGNIKGYGNPSLDLIYYPGLDLASKDGVGVCRNMADDVARKLNAIDEKYNARVINVYAEGTGYKNADIDINIIENDSSQEEENTSNETTEEILNNLTKFIGNHAVVILDITEDNVTLVLDPTNPGIGIVKDGKIILLNAQDNSSIQEKITPTFNYFNYSTINEHFNLSGQLLSSFKESNLSFEDLNNKYGLEAQNNALQSLKDKEKSFKDTLVIPLSNNKSAIGYLSEEKQLSQNEKDKER